MSRIAVLGAGGMGTALAWHLARAAHQVRLWARDPAQAAELRSSRENRRHLAGVSLPAEVLATAEAAEAAGDAELLIAAIPSAYLRSTLAAIAHLVAPRRTCRC